MTGQRILSHDRSSIGLVIGQVLADKIDTFISSQTKYRSGKTKIQCNHLEYDLWRLILSFLIFSWYNL